MDKLRVASKFNKYKDPQTSCFFDFNHEMDEFGASKKVEKSNALIQFDKDAVDEEYELNEDERDQREKN